MSLNVDYEQASAASVADWLIPHRDAYLRELDRLGYAANTTKHHKAAVNAFIAQAVLRKVASSDLDQSVCAELQGAVRNVRSAPQHRYRQTCISRYVAWLVSAGVIDPPEPPPPPAPGSLEHLSAAYGDWMRLHQGLAQSTIKERQAFLRRFMTFRFGAVPGDLNDITPDNIRAFFGSACSERGKVRSWLADDTPSEPLQVLVCDRPDAAEPCLVRSPRLGTAFARIAPPVLRQSASTHRLGS